MTNRKKTDDADRVPSTLVEASATCACRSASMCSCARGNVIIDGSCLHSTLYVGGNLVVKGRLQGGTVYANGLMYVEGQLGSDYTVPTRIMMGYNPFEFLSLQKIGSQIAWLKDRLAFFEKMAARIDVMRQEYAPRIELISQKLKIALSRHNALWRKFAVDEQNAPKCRIVVPGKVIPGCEIDIARAYYRTTHMDANVTFSLVGDDVVLQPGKKGADC